MLDGLKSLHVTRCDPDRNMARYYSLNVHPTLFGEVSFVRNWGRIGTRGQHKIKTYTDTAQLDKTYEKLTQQKRRKGYR